MSVLTPDRVGRLYIAGAYRVCIICEPGPKLTRVLWRDWNGVKLLKMPNREADQDRPLMSIHKFSSLKYAARQFRKSAKRGPLVKDARTILKAC